MNDVFLFGYLTSKIYCPACVSRMGFGARCSRCFNNDSTHQEQFFLFWILIRIADVARYGVFAKRVLEDASHHKRGRLGYERAVVVETPLSPGDHSPSLFATI